MDKILQAKRLLVHYFDIVGAVNDSDNVAEIEAIVDLIVDGVKEDLNNEENKS